MPVSFDRVDLDFILRQIEMAEAGQPPVSPHLAFGLRELAGTDNNTQTGLGGPTSTFGAADQSMPLFAPDDQIFTAQYVPGSQFVFDSEPRTISNLIADQTASNPAAVQAFMAANGLSSLVVQDPITGAFSADPLAVDINGVSLVSNLDTTTGTFDINPLAGILSIPNVTPDGGISAPYSTWFTLFGQFFDHGLDLITKSAAGPQQELIFITLNPDDPLYVPGGPNFMIVARAEDAPGASTPTNLVTPFVDQNQTYTSNPSHQVFLREYTGGVGIDPVTGQPVITGDVAATGELLNHLVLNADGTPKLDANGNPEHTLPTWADVKANALKIGIKLDDHDVGNVPLLATDAFGNLILGPHGLAQVVVDITQLDPDGITLHHTQHLVEGTADGILLTAPPLPEDINPDLGIVQSEVTLRIGHAFINDMAAAAAPFDEFGVALQADSDGALGLSDGAGFYDNELLDQHFVAGDGRVNENIGLTTVHQIFENEHNRLVDQIRDQVQQALNAGDTSFALGWVKSQANLALTADDVAAGRTVHQLTEADFNGDRLFQAAKFGTETQYQHLVFEEFARKVVPTIHVAGDTNIHLDPAITSEFANAVYRFGHSMLDESIQVQAVNADGTPMVDGNGNPVFTQEGLIQAFTNPLDFVKYGAAGIAQGATNQVGNEIDEFVTGALRNNLLGLPLDLAAINIARGRDTGIPTLNAFRNEIYAQTHDANLRPYMSWDDFRLYLKHDASIVNFVAAYGNYVDLQTAGLTDAQKRTIAAELVNGTHINSVTGLNDSDDFMHSRGVYANVTDPTAAINQADQRLLHEVQLDPATHQPVLDGSGNPLTEVAPWSTGSVTGLDNVDMWIGGLAEKQSLNGSLLGTTFELIFRVQLESLQDADRLYYLPRIEGTHYSDQIENNTFADMIQTDLPGTHHVPAAIFMTMEYNIEAKDFYQTDAASGDFILDGSGNPQWDLAKIAAWNALNPAAPGAPALLEVTAKGELHFNGEDYFFGNTMVLGGTDANDKLLAGNADDDTVWGDGGNDTIDGGGGNDNMFGGAGDDFISDQAGLNVAHGDAGNDTILMGKGADVIFGGDGNDLIVAGGGDDEVLGGTGNDIIFGGEGADEMEGDQGDDWIDGRGLNVDPKFGGQEGGDTIFGDVGAPTGQLPLYDGNDVLLGGVGTIMKGFGGDDIMLGVGGMNKFEGGTGFDWASFELETQGVSADMQRREFVSPLNPIDGDGFRTVFTHVEGISGSQFGDILLGENLDKVARLLAKEELYNFNLVHGLIDLNFGTPAAPTFTRTVNGTVEGNFFAQGTQTFAGGDIMLGGGGSDRLEGSGGADIIDGDAFLHVDLTRDANGNIFAGSQIIREIRYADATAADANAVDTAVYNDNAGNYTLTIQVSDGNGGFGPTITQALDAATIAGLADGSIRLGTDAQGFATLAHLTGNAALVPAATPLRVDDGIDSLRNIERLEFADQLVDISGGRNHTPGGALTISDPNPRDPTGAPAVGDTLTGTSTITDADFAGGVITSPITYQWQYQDIVRGEWLDITDAKSVGTPGDFVPGDFFQGLSIRLKASYTDPHGYLETVASDPLVAGALLLADPAKNTGPTGQQVVLDFLGDTTAYEGEAVNIFIPVQNKFVDDHTASTALTYKAAIIDAAGVSHDITGTTFNGLQFTVQTDATGAVIGANVTGTIPDGVKGPITVRMSVSDDGDFPLRPAGVPITVLTTTADFKINVVNATGPAPATETAADPLAAEPSQGMGVHFDRVDLDFILQQIKTAEAHQPPVAAPLAFGLRTVSGGDNSILAGQDTFGQSDQSFPRLTTPVLGIAQDDPTTPGINLTSYAQTHGFVFDSNPRLISNLIADQSTANPAALEAATSQATVMPAVQDPTKVAAFDGVDPMTGLPNFSIPNVTPDGGISAPFNTWFTLFGQFFDHGLDLVNKGGNGEVIIPLLPDDPLFQAGSPTNFMVLTRGTLIDRTAGADGIVGTADDQFHDATNAITPLVDQSQTYSSHPSHQVFLREYAVGADNQIHSTGRMLDHVSLDGSHHMPTWSDVKLNARDNLGLTLSDYDVVSVPLVLADEYGNVVRGPHGFAQVVYQVLITDNATHITTAVERTIEGVAGGLDIDHIPVPGDIVQDLNHTYTTQYVGAGAAFINDMAHNASPFNDFGQALVADGDSDVGNIIIPDAQGQNPVYDDELLDSHFVAGDGRVNENIGLTAIHDVFHSEHNRLVAQTEALVQQQLDNGDTSFVKEWVLPGVDVTALTAADIAAGRSTHLITADEWNGERIFQVARFGTETQYQHLVFEEFARKIAPDIHLSGDTNVHLDPAVFAEFAHTVYRFGHSMLDENLQRFSIHQGAAGDPLNGTPELDANGNPILLDADGNPVSTDIALLTAFTNPLAYLDAGKDAAGQLALGSIAQVGNEIDEFVTGTLRNNLLGLPLDLAALNIARGRSEGVPTLNMVRNELFSQTGDHVLKPYDSWHEFGQFLKHPASLINFVAAYGTDITGTAAERRADATLIVTAGENDASHGNSSDVITLHNGDTMTVSEAWDFMHSAGVWANIPLDANYLNDARAVHSVEIDPNTGNPVTDATGNPVFDPNPPTYSTGSITGLDQVDFWIGGLAEKQNLHDSMLGSTFDFVFKLEMENLQDGDRLYYLPRIEGMHFSDQIEENTFAAMVMNATGTHHLSASIFLTPEYQIEADSFYLHNADGSVQTDLNGNALIDQNAALPGFTGADGLLHPLIEIQPDGTVHFLGEDNFFGNTMVLGGTDANDRLMAGQADDDTVWGDGGNDTIDGGGGNDNLFGGDGNDVLSNSNSSIGSVFHGDAGDDTIVGSKGDDAITGGDGNDVIYGGQGVDDIVGGTGNDIIFGGEGAEEIQGDQGDDWIDGGPDGGDVLFGDVGAPTGGFPLYAGNDVLIGGVGTVMKGFSGDDIMLGVGGFTKFDGGLGFDWASFENETQSVEVDMARREFIADQNPAGGDGFRDIYQLTEGASGSMFDDVIKGDNKTRVVVARNTLDDPTLIKGLADVSGDTPTTDHGTTKGNLFFAGLPTGAVFSDPALVKAAGDFGGNILLGGAGSDSISGGSGDDILDGDAYLHVELLHNANGEIGAGSEILREIRYATNESDVDTAVFSANWADYTITAADSLGFITVTETPGAVPPGGNQGGVGGAFDGTDRIRNFERVQFADFTFTIDKVGNLYDDTGQLVAIAQGNDAALGDFVFPLTPDAVFPVLPNAIPNVFDAFIPWTIDVATPGVNVDGTPEVGKPVTLRVSNGIVTDTGAAALADITDADFAGGIIPTGAFKFQWQFLDIKLGDWTSISDPHDTNPLLPSNGATSVSFTPGSFFLGQQLRVIVSYTDPLGHTETIISQPTPGLLDVTRAVTGDGSGFAPGTAIDPVTLLAANTGPEVLLNTAHNGFDNTAAQQDKPIQGMFLPLVETFNDSETAPVQLGYKAEIIDANGVAHLIGGSSPGSPGTALAGATPFMGLSFTVDTIANAAGGVDVADGHITGTPTFADGSAHFTGPIHVRITATDEGTPALGGGFVPGTGLAVTNEFDINVMASTNQAPVITSDGGGDSASISVPENSTAVTTVTAVDPNADTVTFSIVGGADAALFGINATTGALSFITAPNFEVPTDVGANNVYDVIVQATDASLSDTQAIAVTVTNVNEAPVITSNGAGNAAAVSVAENSTAVTTVTATDPDAGATVTYSLVGGADQSKFSINATTGALSFVTAPDFETPTDVGANNIYDVIVQASDGSLVDTQAIAVSVSNVAGLTLTGTAAANTLTGAGEEDIISGLGGADTISGAGGNDTITGGTGNDIINAGAGNDLILFTIGDGADTIIGDLGVDTLNITGTAAADTLAVLFNGSVLTGIAGGTLSTVETVNANLLGGSDTLSYGTTTAGVSVNLASNSASGFASITGIENVTGGAGADTLIGNGLDNVLNGGTGDDTLSGGLGVDTLTGGAGVDTVSYLGETDAMFISLATGTAQRGSAAAAVDDVLVTLENVIGGTAGDSITGSTGNNLLDGGAGFGNDSIDGGAGNDTIIGGGGDDQLLGGVGADSIDGGVGNDSIIGGAGNDTLLGGDGNDSFSYTFGDGVDVYNGGIGTDTLGIIGTTANNALGVVFDGTSITSFTGGTIVGIETLTVDLGAGTDTLSYAGTTADVSVDLTGHTASGIASLFGVENVTGGSGNDTLIGDAAANVLAGGIGNDTYFIGAGDTVTEGAGAGTDTVNSSATFTLGANVENLTLTGTADINGTGNGLANVMLGNSGANVLNGAAGNDSIEGGAGSDTMTGGTGNDMFVFKTGFGNDVITDFDANPTGGQDLLDLSAYVPDINAGNFGDHVSIAVSAGNTVITIDGTQHITLTGVTGVGANVITTQDFLL